MGRFRLLAIVSDACEATFTPYPLPGPLCVSVVPQVHSMHCSMAGRRKKDWTRIGH